MQETPMGDTGSLAQAQERIASQAAEIERLGRLLRDGQSAEPLRRALAVASAAGVIASPTAHASLLELIVATAAQVLKARAAALFSLDHETQELVFEVALGEKAKDVKRFRVPVGQSIAGLVALSGQPMAISHPANDPHHASDIAQQIGYLPKGVLCVPLFYHSRVIGVLEMLDKEDDTSFRPHDIETLGLFANQAAIAFELSRTRHNLHVLIRELVVTGDADPAIPPAVIEDAARAFSASVAEDPSHLRAVNLAQLVHEIASEGESESTACQAILQSFAEYLRSRPHRHDGIGLMGLGA